MGQKIREDKIGALSHNAGSISLAASYLTIGGQQYSTGALSRTIATDVSMAANSLYMIYAVLVSGVAVLRISSNVNSVGPAGFNVWKLVGAFYSNGSSTFGSFVNIEGAPASGPISFLPNLTSSGGGAVTLNATSKTDPNGFWQRNGNILNFNLTLRNGSGGAASGAAGSLNVQLDSLGITFDLSNLPTAIGGVRVDGSAQVGTSSNIMATLYLISGAALRTMAQASTNYVQISDMAAGYYVAMKGELPVQSWSNTPLKDL